MKSTCNYLLVETFPAFNGIWNTINAIYIYIDEIDEYSLLILIEFIDLNLTLFV